MSVHEEDQIWRGPGTLMVGDATHSVDLALSGFFQPVDGRYAWFGRILGGDPALAALANGKHQAELTTAHGTRPCVVADRDLWGRLRVTGSSTPPFPVDMTISADLAIPA